MSKKRKNKNSVNNVNVNNEEGRIMSMLNGMMNGGNIMNNQFTNPNIATQAQHVLNQTAASGSGQVQYGYIPVDIPQQQQTQGTVFQQAPIDPNAQQNTQQQGFTNPNSASQSQFVNPNAQQNAQAQTQQQNAQQQGFTNPNSTSQAQFVDPNIQENTQQQGFTNPNSASQAQFVNPNAQSQQQTTQNQQNAQQQGFTNPKNQNEQVNDNKEDNIMNTETNETSTSIIEDHPFISTALGIVGGILLGKFFFGSDDSSSSDVITIDTTATDDSI